MKENIRIAECLVSKKNPRIERYAIVNGTRHIIHNDKGFEYFYIDHPTAPLGLYSNHIRDAIEAIKEGKAHALLGNSNPVNVFQSQPQPIFILDDDIAKEYRSKTLEGFKDSEFGYSVKLGHKNSFSSASYLDENAETVGWGNKNNPVFFETEQEAKDFAKSYIDEAVSIAKKVVAGELTLEEGSEKVKGCSLLDEVFFDCLEEGTKNDEVRFKSDVENNILNSKYRTYEIGDVYVDVVQSIKV